MTHTPKMRKIKEKYRAFYLFRISTTVMLTCDKR